jgi:hypothetical protein
MLSAVAPTIRGEAHNSSSPHFLSHFFPLRVDEFQMVLQVIG